MKKILFLCLFWVAAFSSEIVEVIDGGKWVVRTDKDPITDKKKVFLFLPATSGVSRFGREVLMAIRCSDDKTEMFINWGDYLSDNTRVTHRLDSQKAETSDWNPSSDNTATFNPKPIEHIKAMMQAEKYAAQITPYREAPITAVFDIKGLGNAIKELRETCKW